MKFGIIASGILLIGILIILVQRILLLINTSGLSQKNYISYGREKNMVLKEKLHLYYFRLFGCLTGFCFDVRGGSDDPNVFNEEELFSFRRITLAPFLVILGYGIVLYGIMKRTNS